MMFNDVIWPSIVLLSLVGIVFIFTVVGYFWLGLHKKDKKNE